MTQLILEHRLKLALPLLLTAFLVVWTLAVQPFSGYGDNWAMWPAMAVLPLAVVIHIYLVVTLRPKWPLVGYAAVHLSALLLVSIICLMRITKDSL